MAIEKVIVPLTRLSQCWEKTGAIKRPRDKRTFKQITQTLQLYAKEIPVVDKFLKELKKSPIATKRLTADIIELSQQRLTRLNLSKKDYFLETILRDILVATKENKPAIKFAQKIINNTDSTTSKYFLFEATGGVLKNTQVAGQFSATTPIIPLIAKIILGGKDTRDFSKQKKFMNIIKTFINHDANVQRIKEFPEVIKTIDLIPTTQTYGLHIENFLRSNSPANQVKDNLSKIYEYVKLMEFNNKNFDIISYLTKNTNLY